MARDLENFLDLLLVKGENVGNKNLKLESIKEEWIHASEKIGGEFNFSEMIKANVNGPIYVFKICAFRDDIKIEIKFSIVDIAGRRIIKKPVEIFSVKNFRHKIELSTWQLDFFDKFFKKKRLKTGNPLFDNKIGVSCKNKLLSKELFSNALVQGLFVENKVNFTVSVHDQSSSIKLIVFDDMSQNSQKIIRIYNTYLLIFDILSNYDMN